MKIEQHVRERPKGSPDGTRKDGIRLDVMIDILTTFQAAGIPDGASVTIYDRAVEVHWTEER